MHRIFFLQCIATVQCALYCTHMDSCGFYEAASKKQKAQTQLKILKPGSGYAQC